MEGVNSSVYVRVPFAVANPAAVDQLLLDVQYDAGFVAYLNGQEVARRNAPTRAGSRRRRSTPRPRWNGATARRSSRRRSTFRRSRTCWWPAAATCWRFHGLNSAAGDDDFLIAPQLRAVARPASRCGTSRRRRPARSTATASSTSSRPWRRASATAFTTRRFSLTLSTPTAGATRLLHARRQHSGAGEPVGHSCTPLRSSSVDHGRSRGAVQRRLRRLADQHGDVHLPRRRGQSTQQSLPKQSVRPVLSRRSGKRTRRRTSTWTRGSSPSGTTTIRRTTTSAFAKRCNRFRRCRS